MVLRTLTATRAAALDHDLLTTSSFALLQLMELAGLAVSHALFHVHPPARGAHVLVVCGPGNNGGDGLVAARHLHHGGYAPRVHYPKPGARPPFPQLAAQLHALGVPFVADVRAAVAAADHVVDAVFGFGFAGGGGIREPFAEVIRVLEECPVGVTAVDAPSGWDVESGPPKEGPGSRLRPGALVSLTAPKPLVKHFHGRHFVGGRFLSKEVADKYEIDIPPYEGVEQVVEIDQNGNRV